MTKAFVCINEVTVENLHQNLEMMEIQLMEMDEVQYDTSNKIISEVGEMSLIKLLAPNEQTELPLMVKRVHELLFEEMVGNIVLKIETMTMNLMMMVVALLER